MKSGSWWRYALGSLLHFFLVYALLVFIYAAVLNGQIEASIRPTLMWSANRTVQGLLQAGDIEPGEAAAYRDEALLALEHAVGFDRPFLIRCSRLWLRTARLDFGYARTETVTHLTGTNRDTFVMNIIAEAFIPAAILFGGAFLCQAVLALFLGLRNGSKPGSAVDRATTTMSIILAGLPPFVLAMFMVSISVYHIPLVPSDPWVYTSPLAWSQLGPCTREFFSHFFLPFLTLLFANICATAHHVKNLSVSAFSEDYSHAARARRLTERKVVYRIGHRVTAPPTLTLITTGFAASLWVGFLVEPIFQWPRIGSLFLRYVTGFDTSMVMGMLVVVTGIYLFGLMVLDLTYGLMDPRIKAGSRAAL